MACIDNHQMNDVQQSSDIFQVVWKKFSNTVLAALEKRAKRRQQRLDRAAFLGLLGKEDWLYRDMGINSGDVAWASKLPLDVNAANEIEKIRQQNRRSL